MLTRWIEKQMKKARFQSLGDEGVFVSIRGMRGPWASAPDKQKAIKEMRVVLEEWFVLSLIDGEKIPGFLR